MLTSGLIHRGNWCDHITTCPYNQTPGNLREISSSLQFYFHTEIKAISKGKCGCMIMLPKEGWWGFCSLVLPAFEKAIRHLCSLLGLSLSLGIQTWVVCVWGGIWEILHKMELNRWSCVSSPRCWRCYLWNPLTLRGQHSTLDECLYFFNVFISLFLLDKLQVKKGKWSRQWWSKGGDTKFTALENKISKETLTQAFSTASSSQQATWHSNRVN